MPSPSTTASCGSSAPRARPAWSAAPLLLALLLPTLLPACGSPEPDLFSEPEVAGDRLEQARIDSYQGRISEAYDRFRALYLEEPEVYDAWEGAVSVAYTPDQVEQVRDDLQRLWPPVKGREIIAFETLRATLDPDVGRREERLYTLIEGEPKRSFRGWPRAGLGYLFFERGSLEAALDALTVAVDDTPAIAAAHLARARVLMQLKRPLDAVRDYEQYLQARPRDPVALYNLAWILLNVRNAPRDARPYLERALAILPRDLDILIALGTAALRTDPPDPGLAEKSYRMALDVAPKDPDVHLNLGVLYADHRNQPAQAVAEFKKYIALGGAQKDRAERWIAELSKQKGRR